MDASAHGMFTATTGGSFGTSPIYILDWIVVADGTDVPVCEADVGFGGRPGLRLAPISGGDEWQIDVTGTLNHGLPFVGANLDVAEDYYLQRIDSSGSVVEETTDLTGGFSGTTLVTEFATGDLIVFGFDILGYGGGPAATLDHQYIWQLRWKVSLV